MPELHKLTASNNQIQYLNGALDSLQKLQTLELDGNSIADLDLLKLSKFEELDEVSLKNTGFNLDAVNVSIADVTASKSKITGLNLSGCKMQSGVIFSKLGLFPELYELNLSNNSLRTMDSDVVRSGGLRYLRAIYIANNNFNVKWLTETMERFQMLGNSKFIHVKK